MKSSHHRAPCASFLANAALMGDHGTNRRPNRLPNWLPNWLLGCLTTECSV